MRPLILVTNDDGVTAPGIRALVEVVVQFGDVIVVAPDSPQSGQGHAITLESPLRLYPVRMFEDLNIEAAYECSGTPVDCVKLAKHVALKGRQIDLCVSGINHGSNASINVIYSGTMSAAMEAAMEGIPAIGFSLNNFSHQADFTSAKYFARTIVDYVLNQGLKESLLLNVNIPDVAVDEIKGIKICRQAKGYWSENFIEGKDPNGRTYYWLSGSFTCEDEGEDTDIWAIENNYISIVPVMYDLTAHTAITELSPLQLPTIKLPRKD